MSDSNIADGRDCFATASADVRGWFERQWAKWPTRVCEKSTTNISFLYGGVVEFRAANGRDPIVSKELQGHIDWLDGKANP